jgi:N-acetylneuraminic acid mutarotase
MLQEKSFFAAVCITNTPSNPIIYTFGGYDNIEKVQLKTCELYNIEKDKWYGNEEIKLNDARS